MTDTIIDAYSTSGAFPFNTDGFDVTVSAVCVCSCECPNQTSQGNDISIKNSVIFNGDDAIAVQTPSRNILFQGGTIGYQTHGLSIGSLGQNQAIFANVSNIKVRH